MTRRNYPTRLRPSQQVHFGAAEKGTGGLFPWVVVYSGPIA